MTTPLSDRLHGTEEERIERAKTAYREGRNKRIPPEPKGRWHDLATLDIPPGAEVIIRTDASGTTWYIGYWK